VPAALAPPSFDLSHLDVQATAFLILFARVGTVLMLLPVFSEDAVPGRIRLLIALGMSIGLWGVLAPLMRTAAAAGGALPAVLLAELITGLAIGALVKIVFSAVSMAGSIISSQIGLSSALLYDASQGGQAALLSKFVTVAAAVVCMSLHVHHLWIGAIIESYRTFPIGGMPPAHDFLRADPETLGIGLSAPLLVYGIVFNVALGLSTRIAPAIQLFFIVQPLNILLGLAVMAMTMGGLLTGFAQAMAAYMQTSWN
jgi:flagellar biosynthesis protein FliR